MRTTNCGQIDKVYEYDKRGHNKTSEVLKEKREEKEKGRQSPLTLKRRKRKSCITIISDY